MIALHAFIGELNRLVCILTTIYKCLDSNSILDTVNAKEHVSNESEFITHSFHN